MYKLPLVELVIKESRQLTVEQLRRINELIEISGLHSKQNVPSMDILVDHLMELIESAHIEKTGPKVSILCELIQFLAITASRLPPNDLLADLILSRLLEADYGINRGLENTTWLFAAEYLSANPKYCLPIRIDSPEFFKNRFCCYQTGMHAFD